MPVRRLNRRRKSKYTPGRRVRLPYSSGQNLPQFSKGKIVHVWPGITTSAFSMAASSTSPLDLTQFSGNAFLLNAIPLSGGITNRTGAKIRMRTLLLNLEVNAPNPSGIIVPAAHYHMRIWVLYDKRPYFGTTTTPSLGDIYENTGYTAFRNLSSRDRYDVLMEKDVVVDAAPIWNGTAAVSAFASTSTKRMSLRIPVNRIASWITSDTTGGLAAFTYGPLYLCATSTSPFVSGQMPVVFYNWKLSFDDLMV